MGHNCFSIISMGDVTRDISICTVRRCSQSTLVLVINVINIVVTVIATIIHWHRIYPRQEIIVVSISILTIIIMTVMTLDISNIAMIDVSTGMINVTTTAITTTPLSDC